MKNNKKILMIGIIVLILILLIVGIIVVKGKSSKNSNEIKKSNNYSEYTDDDSENNLTAKESAYNTESLEKLNNLEELDGKIIDMKNSGNDLYASTSNKIYQYSYSGFKELLESTKSIKSMVFVADDIFILQNSDNSYSIYGKYYESSNSKITSSFKELEGIDVENVIYAMDSDNNNKFILIREYNDGYYVDMYELDTNKEIKSKELKIPLYLSLGMSNTKEVNNIKQIYVESQNKLIFTLSDGTVHETGTSISFSDVDNGYIKLYMEGTEDEDLSDVNKVYAKGSTLKYGRPLFEKNGDKNNLYTYNKKAPQIGTPDEQYKIIIPLPDEYTTDDIKNVIFEEDLVIEFNDNNIYISDNNSISELSLNENLSSLNKSDKIKDIAISNLGIVVLMDDKCIYKIDI